MLHKYTSLALLMCTIWQLIHSDGTNIVTDDVTCRDKHGTLGFDDFVSRSCVMCYSYLFAGQGLYQPSGHKLTSMTLLSASRAVDYGDVTLPRHVMPDPRNHTATSAVCLSLSDDECARWLSCCQDAVTCCHKQADTPVADGDDDGDNSLQGSRSCPRIWDGYRCWDDQAPGTVAKQSCPNFLPSSDPDQFASKTCLENGEWYSIQSGQWTNYTSCHVTQTLQLVNNEDTTNSNSEMTCDDRFGTLGFDNFVSRSCVMCYSYLFTGQGLYQPSGHKLTSMTLLNASRAVDYGDVTLPRHVMPDPRNDTATSAVCLSLSDDECARWLSCCQDAVTCCHRQADTPVADGGDSSQGSESCPRIWDGYGCWDDQAPGTVAKQSCPYFLKHSITTKDASKTCLADGTWFMKSGMQWTDYTGCMSIHSHMTVVYISLTCSAISLLLLVPSTVIFLIYRELRKQQRVRLHINFFIALALSAAFSILWYSLVHYDMLANTEQTQAVINRNPAWCRVLSFGKIYFSSCTFSWMFCEGIYLHRLITKAFSPPKHLFLLYIIGWSVPALPALCYSIIRAVLANDSCWAKSYGYYEWIIYTPNVICLVVNMIFLCNILWILLFKMRSHPHEPNNFRRGFKAACMLVPLFGLQMLLTIYRPDDSWSLAHYYECLAHVINNSQGICVALIFCVFNGEVSHQIRSTCSCLPCMSPPPRRGRMSSAPTTMVSTCDDVKSSINPSRSTSGGGFNAATNNGSAGGGGGGDRETQAQLLRRSRDCSDVTTPDEPVEMTVYSKTDASTNGSATVTGNRNDAGADETSNLVIHASDA